MQYSVPGNRDPKVRVGRTNRKSLMRHRTQQLQNACVCDLRASEFSKTHFIDTNVYGSLCKICLRARKVAPWNSFAQPQLLTLLGDAEFAIDIFPSLRDGKAAQRKVFGREIPWTTGRMSGRMSCAKNFLPIARITGKLSFFARSSLALRRGRP